MAFAVNKSLHEFRARFLLQLLIVDVFNLRKISVWSHCLQNQLHPDGILTLKRLPRRSAIAFTLKQKKNGKFAKNTEHRKRAQTEIID